MSFYRFMAKHLNLTHGAVVYGKYGSHERLHQMQNVYFADYLDMFDDVLENSPTHYADRH